MPDITADQPDLSAGAGTVKDAAATQQSLATMGAPPGGQTQGNAGPGAGNPISPQQPGAPGGPTQPQPQPQQASPDGTNASVDPTQIFDQTIMSRLVGTPPFRQYLQQAAANHPLGAPYLQRFADMVSSQKGPLDK